MRKNLFLVLILLYTFICNAQVRDLTQQDTAKKQKSYLIEVKRDNQPTILTYFLVVTAKELIWEKFVRSDELIKKYGEKAKKGVLVETLKPKLQLLTFKELLVYYKVQASDRKLEVFVDSIKVQHPLTIIAVKESVKNVSVINSNKRKRKVINITTINHPAWRDPVGSETL